MSPQQQRTSLIQSLLGGRRRQAADEEADRELDLALVRLSLACDENTVATTALRRRQSSGSLKVVSLPEPPSSAAER